MKITQELIQEVCDKTNSYLKAKYGLYADYLRIEDGVLSGIVVNSGCCGDPDEHEPYCVNLEELELDLDELTRIREEEERQRKERVEKEAEKRRKEEEVRKKEFRKQEYLKLKKEFE